MPTLLLIRHGLTALTGPILAGRTPGLHLDERGHAQAAAVASRLAPVPLAAVVTSPLDRCAQTAAAITAGRDIDPTVDERLLEADYGEWTGGEIKKLAKDPLWRQVQAHPSAVTFPGGESLRGMSARAVDAVRDWNDRLGDDATFAVVSHGDIIKAIVGDALGVHLDLFQRIQVDPCSLTVIRYAELRAFVVRLNDVGGDVGDLLPPKRKRRARRSSDAVVGGGAGGAA
ncbi:MAG TPA: MSMEG_4193 family putative phosphomutase [Mycobacteriales bacterium]|jgi:probable phosphoglycerate mutase|nr:MSMEG_4193 family putative phosphomutase [Mycobacteriales bacterium]